ncbi:MAG: DUF11 domain-containing protein [Planctomycetes bacterium]|nr:DUF11 domain-containing protein [Planctomycetota bacterium]MBL7146603.1 DUF11 domain-containing protein [Phycisphaerae bacterium]
MKKILTISLILLVFSSLGCESMKSFFKPKEGEPELKQPEKFFWDSSHEPIAIAPINAVPAPLGGLPVRIDGPVVSEGRQLVVLSQSDMAVISMTYPWPECGIVRLDKTVPREVELNRSFDYFIAVTNLTEAVLTDIVVNEELSRGFEFTRSNPAARKDVDKLVWEIKSLGPKASKRITVSGVASSADSLEHCTTVITPIIPACAPIRIVQPRLELARVAPDEALLCEAIPVVFVVTNSGTGSAQNVRIIDELSIGLRTTDGKSKLVLDVGTLAEGQSRQFSAELRAAKVGRYTSKAVATSATGLRAESAETTTIVSLPVLTIENNVPRKHYLGRKVTYEITVANKSDIPAKNTIVEDTVPNGATSIEADEGAKLSGSKLIWEFGTLAPNSIKKVRVSYVPTEPGMQTNSATVTAYCSEAVTASVPTEVTGISAVSLEVVDVEDPVKVGSQTTYVISVTNQGSAAATNIRINCLLEGNVQYVSSAGATAGSLEGQMVKFYPLSSLEPKARAAWRVVVAAVKPGDVRFKAVMNVDQLTRPVEETESTNIYE